MNIDKLDAEAIGERIRELRRRRNWTQAQLAEKVDICTGPMNALENGHHLPSLPVLCKLSAVLECDVNQLLHGAISTYALPSDLPEMMVKESGYDAVTTDAWNLYRASVAAILRFEPYQKPLPDRTLGRINAVIRNFLALEDICGVQKQARIPLRLALPTQLSGLERFANRVRGLFGVNDAVIFDYLELFENNGLRVILMPLGEGVDSVSCYDRKNENAFFFIDREYKNVERQLFLLCYELGRIYLYNGGMGQQDKIGSKDFDHAARYFAAMFLMPEDAVLTTVAQVGVKKDEWTWEMVMRLKHRFGVSAEAFLYRLDDLKLIEPDLKMYLKEEIKQYYFRHGRFVEPDSSRRLLSPNGRIGDLLTVAKQRKAGEADSIRQSLKQNEVVVE